MKITVVPIVLTCLLLLLFSSTVFGHGGQYRGPGDYPPPNLDPYKHVNQSSLKPVDAQGPVDPFGKATAGSNTPSNKKSTGGLQRKGGTGMGFTRWEFWWEYNKDSILKLRKKLFENEAIRGSSSYLTGRRNKWEFHTTRKTISRIMEDEVLPCLLQSLSMDHPDIQDSSVLAIARITQSANAPEVIDRITRLLQSKHYTAQQSACLSLGVLGSEKSVPLCLDLLFDTPDGQKHVGRKAVPSQVRAFAALSLGLIGDAAGAKGLMRAVEGAASKEKDLISCAITALGLFGDTSCRKDIIPFLVRKLDDPKLDPFLKAYIPIALGKLNAKEEIGTITRLFKQGNLNAWIRQSCVIAMGQLVDLKKKDHRLLIDYIKNGTDQQTRNLCFIALARICARDPAIPSTAKYHYEAMKCYGSEIRDPSHYMHRSWAAIAAGLHGIQHGVIRADMLDVLTTSFKKTKNPSDKAALALCLGLINANSTAPLLYDELRTSKDKLLQGYLCVSLGLMNWTEATETIRTLAAREDNYILRLQSTVSLGLLGDMKAMNVLITALQNSDTLYNISSAARALGHIGDVSAIAPLKAIIADRKSNSLSKAFAVVALGIMGEKTDLPWNARISEDCNYLASTRAMFEVLDIL